MSIKIVGLNSVSVAIDGLSKNAVKSIGEVLSEGGQKIHERQVRLSPKGAEGNLLQNSNFVDTDNPLKVILSNPVFYAPYVEFGTKGKFDANGRDAIASQFKGKSSKGGTWEEMKAAIFKWLDKKKFFPPEIRGQKAKINYANYIAMRIAKFGIKPQPFFYKAYDEVLPEIIRDLKAIFK